MSTCGRGLCQHVGGAYVNMWEGLVSTCGRGLCQHVGGAYDNMWVEFVLKSGRNLSNMKYKRDFTEIHKTNN